MPKSYTRTGDDGTTGRLGGQRIKKTAPLAELLGTLDEANAAVGLARSLLRSDLPRKSDLDSWLQTIQDALFRIGADLSAPLDRSPLAPRITVEDTLALEKKIDAIDEKLPEIRQFILPGGTETAAALHLSRAMIRRAERRYREAMKAGENLNKNLGPYLNRLSSYFFALARWTNHVADIAEQHPRYTID